MNDQNLMQIIIIAILLLCGYLYLLQFVVKHSVNRSANTLLAIVLLIIYTGISVPLLMIFSRLGDMNFILLAILLLTACIVLFAALYGCLQHFRELNKGMLALFILYVLMVGYITIFSRTEGHSREIILQFDSIEEALKMRSIEPLQHLWLNILMFVPIGVLFSLIQPDRLAKLIFAIPLGLLLSTVIETTQMLLQRGQCDIEDIFANTLGAFIGLLLVRIFRRRKTE
ncbi:MAG TPA: hypothetical protein DCG37_01550 [Lachnospiraceae bacterium]|nr:hypothetical protein [Lachnospiraceae bacterium]